MGPHSVNTYLSGLVSGWYQVKHVECRPERGLQTHHRQEGGSGKTTWTNLKDKPPGERRPAWTATCGREVSGLRTSLETEARPGVAKAWKGAVSFGVMTRLWNQIEGWEHSAVNGLSAAGWSTWQRLVSWHVNSTSTHIALKERNVCGQTRRVERWLGRTPDTLSPVKTRSFSL